MVTMVVVAVVAVVAGPEGDGTGLGVAFPVMLMIAPMIIALALIKATT